MAETYAVKPDREFIRRICDAGGGDLKQCFQCAACSVVCQLASEHRPFPRKEMIWAQWGLKDRLVADPDVWLCHQCNDCSTKCPRGARPADVLAALRREHVRHYAVPRFLGRWAGQVKCIPLLLLVPAALLALVLVARPALEKRLALGPDSGFYAGFFPHWLLISFFTLFTALAFVAAAAGVVRFWRAMKAADASAGRGSPVVGLPRSVVRTVKSVCAHGKFGQCTNQASRRLAHLAAFYGFVALLMVSGWAVIDLYVLPRVFVIETMYPYGLAHPAKILANLGCVALIVGCVIALRDRQVRGKEKSSASTSFDWTFVWLLLIVAVTGLLTEVLRFVAEPGDLAALKHAAFAVYFGHLVVVFALLVYLPYSKFAHVVYRTAALIYAEHSGRDRTTAEPRT